MLKILVTLFEYLETIVNIFSNALIQTFLVYTTVVLIYKFYIEEQTTNYIPTFIVQILDKIKNTFSEVDLIRSKISDTNKIELESKYEKASQEAIIIKKQNKEHNAQVINNALKMSIGILSFFVIFALITRHMSINIHWYQLLLSAVITVVGTSYEYFFITQVIVKYHFIELTKIYDAMVSKIETISNNIIEGELKDDLKQIVNNHNNNNNNGINNLVSGAKDIIAKDNLDGMINHVGEGILNELQKHNQTINNNNVNNNVNNNNVNNNIISKVVSGNINVNNLVDKAGLTLNDVDHNKLKASLGY